MPEYISREEAIKELREVYENEYPTASGDFDEYASHDMPNVLRNIPAADVQPVKRGRWIIADDVEHFIAVCSECGRTEDSRDIKDMPYCHCGARMDLEDGDAK